ncbi:MAG: glutamate--cysteine ligase [Polyangiaceae bacterium]|nr:glutamate--cysteine ligase [Polyangiaceae bacterium]
MTTCLPLPAPSFERGTLRREELELPFVSAEKPRERWRIGLEAEKFGVFARSCRPLAYDAPDGVLCIFDELARTGRWRRQSEYPGGPVVALKRHRAAITLEPGAQFELSGSPHRDVHAVVAELEGHMAELAPICRELGLVWLGVGFHPLATQDDLSWVPKRRYPVMSRYLMTRGTHGLDMMRRTATVQANFDYESEADAMKKLAVCLRLVPVLGALFANAPLREGRLTGAQSLRQGVWLDVDPERTGLIPALWRTEEPRYAHYIDWALGAGMFLLERGDQIVLNTGQPFASFLDHGFETETATLDDWKLHLGTLFPEVRLRKTIEVRCCDALPATLTGAVPALLTGILYDARALDRARDLVAPIQYEEAAAARIELTALGLRAELAGRPMLWWAERVLDIASAGLAARARRRADGRDERVYLEPLVRLVGSGQSPADALIDRLARAPLSAGAIAEACSLGIGS